MSYGHQTRSKASASGVRVATETTIENDALNGVEQDNAELVQKSPVCAYNEWDPLEVCVCVCVEHCRSSVCNHDIFCLLSSLYLISRN